MKKTIIFIISLFLLTGCSDTNEALNSNKGIQDKESKQRLSIWLPEWEMESALKDVMISHEGLVSLRVFGAYFNEKDKPFFTEKMTDLHKQIDDHFQGSHSILLTFINDYVVEGQPSVQKDSELLHRLVKDELSRKSHIDDIISFTENYNADGVEIDYEKINQEDLINYTLFLQELYEALSQKDLSLHVVLDPSFQFDTSLPDGPNYSVMAYNVHGYHSGPGAKTTFEFLDDLLKRLEQSNQSFDIAFATGGFTWPQDGQPVALTGSEAKKLISSKSATTVRDKHSDAIQFHYKDDQTAYEAWYADTKTIQSWIDYIREKDPSYEHFILWRAGGLTSETLEWIKNE